MLDQLGLPVKFTHENAERGASIEYMRENIRLSPYRRVIFLHRNPLDTLVSYYHQLTDVDRRFSGTIAEFVRDPRCGIRYILEFNKAWLTAADQFDDFLPISYEDLHTDTPAQLRRIVDFCNSVSVSDRAIRKAISSGEFDRMKQLEQSGKLAKLYPGKFAEVGANQDRRKVRSGKIGNYRTALLQEDIDYCVEQAREAGWPIEKLLAPGDPQLTS